jgi:lysophospholipase L1-like esterase
MRIPSFHAALVSACLLATPSAHAATTAPADDVQTTCPAMSADMRDALAMMRDNLIEPGRKIDMAAIGQSPTLQKVREEELASKTSDWPNLCRYKNANTDMAARTRPDVIFIGSSVTENWAIGDPQFFDGKTNVNRGIGGQTTPQILLRFMADAVRLRPKVIHILAGSNDIAGNTGPIANADIENNLDAMMELALAHHIKVILSAITPSEKYPWSPVDPKPRIRSINGWIQTWAGKPGVTIVDYAPALDNGQGAIKAGLSNDGVHPNRDGYRAMRPLAQSAIRAALAH